VQYDFGKTVEKGQFVQTGILNKPPKVLLTGVTKLRANHERKGSAVPLYLLEMLGSYPAMRRRFQYPGREHDQLFNADYGHNASGKPCQECDKSCMPQREIRDTNDPVIHYGLIASANQVMRDGVTRERLRREYGMLCFEMEAAGLMDEFPCLVIRGICDYSDTHKNKRWQAYAAATAAAYAKELLNTIPVVQVKSTREAADVVRLG
jgi:hypothetical protein